MKGLHHEDDLAAAEAALASPRSELREAALERMIDAVEAGDLDDDLGALGDRMVLTLETPAATPGDDTVFARAFAVLVLEACVERDAAADLLPQHVLSRWCASFCRWYSSERDERGFVPGKGWAHAIAHGADAASSFARSPRIADAERSELATAIVNRTLVPGAAWAHGEADRVALALDALPAERDDVIDRLGAALAARPADDTGDPYPLTVNADQLLRALLLRSAPGEDSDHRIRDLLTRAHPRRGRAPRKGLHHVEVWVADLEVVSASWGWLFGRVGFECIAEWPEGQSWDAGGTYVTLTTSPNLSSAVHDRRSVGVNHLAVWGGAPREVDAIMAAAPSHGWRPLYRERYPHAGGPDHYAGWLENDAGFKVEVVAEPPA